MVVSVGSFPAVSAQKKAVGPVHMWTQGERKSEGKLVEWLASRENSLHGRTGHARPVSLSLSLFSSSAPALSLTHSLTHPGLDGLFLHLLLHLPPSFSDVFRFTWTQMVNSGRVKVERKTKQQNSCLICQWMIHKRGARGIKSENQSDSFENATFNIYTVGFLGVALLLVGFKSKVRKSVRERALVNN